MRSDPANAPAGRILHVDDDRASLAVIGEWLRQQGHTVWLATGPAEADAVLAREEVELVLTDIHMRGNERLEWVERLLEAPGRRAIVLITGNPEFETACRAANLPVAGYLLKPPNFAGLAATIARAITEQRQRTAFLAVSREILDLLATRGAGDPARERALAERLAQLARQFAARGGREAPDAGSATPPVNETSWREAIEDAVAVIQRTKDSFHSKELGRLRARLQQFLKSRPDAASPVTESH